MKTTTTPYRGTLIGHSADITHATNLTYQGLHCTIIDETRHLLILTGDKKIHKHTITLALHTPNHTQIINGTALVGRPEERIKQ